MVKFTILFVFCLTRLLFVFFSFIFSVFFSENWITLLSTYLFFAGSLAIVSSVTQSFLSLRPHGLQHARLPCPSPTPRAWSNSCPLSWWCHPTISSSVVPFSSCLQSFPASGSFPVSQFFTSGGQSIGASASASIVPLNIQDWYPLWLTGWISSQSKGLSRIFSNTTVQKHRSFLYSLTLTSIHDYWKNYNFD